VRRVNGGTDDQGEGRQQGDQPIATQGGIQTLRSI
jgi:hypothetical protein